MARLGTVIRLSDRVGATRSRRAGRAGLGGSPGGAPERPMIELSSVGVRYDGRMAVEDVTLSVGRGEWIGLIGANGAGKTTLLRALAGLTAHQGAIRIDGRLTGGMARRERARAIAYVPQSPELPDDMPVFDYVLLGRTPHIAYLSVESATDVAHSSSLLTRLGLAELAVRHLATLSGGERQRVVLARALAQEAPVLLMDEPTSALDLGRRVDALETVDELRREWGLTVVSAMHDLTLAGQFADRLLLLANAAVAAFGTPTEVLDESVLQSAYDCAVRIIRTDDGDLVIAPRRTSGRASGGDGGSGATGHGIAGDDGDPLVSP
jgi:iron complex transport system ATP-binding protein